MNVDNRLQQVHRRRIEAIHRDSEELAGVMRLIHQRADTVLKVGGRLDAQKQMNYALGAVARILKDWGVVEHLQEQLIEQKAPARPA
jgi:hypothetical protein